jgi:hypothetical protein
MTKFVVSFAILQTNSWAFHFSAVICSNFSGSTNDNVPHSSKPAYLHLDHTSFPDEHTPSTNQSAARSCCHATKSCNHSLVEKLDINKVYSRIQHKTSPLNTPEAPEGETVPCFTGYIRSEGTVGWFCANVFQKTNYQNYKRSIVNRAVKTWEVEVKLIFYIIN